MHFTILNYNFIKICKYISYKTLSYKQDIYRTKFFINGLKHRNVVFKYRGKDCRVLRMV